VGRTISRGHTSFVKVLSYIITLPKKLIEELKWEIGTELRARVEGS